MKIAIIYNRESKRVINLFGVPNRERYGLAAIKRIADGLRKGGHQVQAFEGDKDLIPNLEHFMPRVLQGERPGMAFNLSYGVQGQARYTHVPAVLEMIGIPYVGSGPLAHSLALDKVVAKMLFRQHDLPTPDFAVLTESEFEAPELEYPLIVKPKNEAVSFGLRIVNNEQELREAAQVIFDEFQQPALVERYIDGREVNVGILGNLPAEALPPVEVLFGEGGPKIYTVEDKRGKSGREIRYECPARIGDELAARAQEIARGAFKALGCFDCARIDMRLSEEGELYILEINSLPSLGEHGSYVVGAEHTGLDFAGLVNRLVEEASARYFGTPVPPPLTRGRRSKDAVIFSFLTGRRDRIEDRLRRWVRVSSRTDDSVGVRNAAGEAARVLKGIGLAPVAELSDERAAQTWESPAGLAGGTLLVANVDVPIPLRGAHEAFRRDPEWLYGEGVGATRGPLVVLEYALRSLAAARLLRTHRLGVLLYADEGNACAYSERLVRAAAERAARVIVLQSSAGDHVVTQRRGQRLYRFVAEGAPIRVDKSSRKTDTFRWVAEQLQAFARLSSREKRLSIAAIDVRTTSYPTLLPHRVAAQVLMAYARQTSADEAEQSMRDLLPKRGFEWDLSLVSDRPPLQRRKANRALAAEISKLAEKWDIALAEQSSALPSAAGLIPAKVPVVCGLGPVVRDPHTTQEAVNRLSLVQRTLLLAQYLAEKR